MLENCLIQAFKFPIKVIERLRFSLAAAACDSIDNHSCARHSVALMRSAGFFSNNFSIKFFAAGVT